MLLKKENFGKEKTPRDMLPRSRSKLSKEIVFAQIQHTMTNMLKWMVNIMTNTKNSFSNTRKHNTKSSLSNDTNTAWDHRYQC